MAIFIDNTGHLVSDTNADELHAFAAKIDLKRSWYQDTRHPHYDCLRSKKRLAIEHGAYQVTSNELIRRAWWNNPTLPEFKILEWKR